MTWGSERASAHSVRRIRGFSTFVWSMTSIILLALGVTAAALVFGATNPGYGGDRIWDDEDPAAATLAEDGVTYSSGRSAVIRLDAAESGEAVYLATLTDSGGDYADLHSSPQSEEDYYPEYLAMLADRPESKYHDAYVVVDDRAINLWVSAEGAWTMTLERVELEEITESAVGEGSQAFIYRGSAISGRIEMDSEESIAVTAYAPFYGEQVVNEYEVVDERFSWVDATRMSDDDDMVIVLQVEVSEYTDETPAWRLTIDQIASDFESTPSAEPGASTEPQPQTEPSASSTEGNQP